jgi:hypothetical protein
VFTTAFQCSTTLHRSVKFSQKRYSLFFNIHFTIISHLRLGLRSILSHQIFYQNLGRISDFYCMFYMLSLSLPPGYHPNNIRCTINYEATRYLQVLRYGTYSYNRQWKLKKNNIQTLTTKKRNVGCGRLNADTCNQIQLWKGSQPHAASDIYHKAAGQLHIGQQSQFTLRTSGMQSSIKIHIDRPHKVNNSYTQIHTTTATVIPLTPWCLKFIYITVT